MDSGLLGSYIDKMDNNRETFLAMKNLLLILALFVVGSEYNCWNGLKETQKLAEVTESDRTLIKDYCKALHQKMY